jgi:hypothetical protein
MHHDWATEWPPERIAAVAQTDGARYISPEVIEVEKPQGRTRNTMARTIIEVGGHFLVELPDSPNDWLMGGRTPEGVIRCWGQYGELEITLRSL